MHVYFSGIGGVGIGPAALIAKQAGYEVSGSDIREGQNIQDLRLKGIDIHIGQTKDQIAQIHAKKPVDWFVYSSAVPEDQAELVFARQKQIKTSKRDEFINEILSQKHLNLVAVAGTHGKTTTTAMIIWLFKQLAKPVSYSVGAKVGDYDMSAYEPESEFFVYECDEFDRNFLAFKPLLSVISGLGYDHHEIYPTKNDYYHAFADFISQSQQTILWHGDAEKLNMSSNSKVGVEQEDNPTIEAIELPGLYNRRDAWLAIKALRELTDTPLEDLIDIINKFPGASRRFEEIVPNLYSDDAHTPEKIVGGMSVARESAAKTGQKIVVLYEPLTNRRMHYTAKDHRDVFDGASKIYWLPSYLAREDPSQKVLTPAELIQNLSPELQKIAEPAERNERLKEVIANHLQNGDMVVAMAGGGADSLDDWLRQEFA